MGSDQLATNRSRAGSLDICLFLMIIIVKSVIHAVCLFVCMSADISVRSPHMHAIIEQTRNGWTLALLKMCVCVCVCVCVCCLLYTSPSPRDRQKARMPSSA